MFFIATISQLYGLLLSQRNRSLKLLILNDITNPHSLLLRYRNDIAAILVIATISQLYRCDIAYSINRDLSLLSLPGRAQSVRFAAAILWGGWRGGRRMGWRLVSVGPPIADGNSRRRGQGIAAFILGDTDSCDIAYCINTGFEGLLSLPGRGQSVRFATAILQ